MRQLAGLVDNTSADSEQRMSEDRLLEVLEEGLAARVIEEMPDSVGVYQFTHALIQQTLFNELTTTRRVRLHARIIEVFEELYSDDLESHAVNLAYHATEAEAMIGPEKVSRYSKTAGDKALSTYAYEDAINHYQRAFAAKEGQPRDFEVADILFGLGRAQTSMFEVARAQEAVDNLKLAFDSFVELGNTQAAVNVAMNHHGFLAFSTGTAAMAAQALEMVAADSIEAGYLLSQLGAALIWETGEDESREHVGRAIEIARHEGDPGLEVRALVYASLIDRAQGRHREAINKSLRVIELAQSIGELYALVRARNLCAGLYIRLGDSDEARVHATAGVEDAERLHNRMWTGRLLNHSSDLAILKGEWNAAQEFNERVLAASLKDFSSLGNEAIRCLHVGEIEKGYELLHEMLELLPESVHGLGVEHVQTPTITMLFSRVTGNADFIDAAESAANALLSTSKAPLFVRTSAWVGLALISIQKNDHESARQQYLLLEPQRGSQDYATVNIDRILAMLSHTFGNLDDSARHFEDALAFCRKAGYLPELAWSLCDYADMLLERKDEGDSEKAVAMLDESLAISTELGMRPLMERVLGRREILKS